jgi:pimeloyl-ACP methyl ester carboxylesterase
MAMISPALEAFVESLSTLKFANRAKNIKNEARVNEDLDQKSLLRRYERELKRLRAELEERSRKWGADPSYEEIVERLATVVGSGTPDRPEDDRLFVIEQSRGPTRRPQDSEVYTYRTWWHSRGPEAYAAMAFRQLPDVTVPTLLVQGTADQVVDPEEGQRQYDLMLESGNDQVELVWVQGAGHFYKGQEILLVDAITRFLGDLA